MIAVGIQSDSTVVPGDGEFCLSLVYRCSFHFSFNI